MAEYLKSCLELVSEKGTNGNGTDNGRLWELAQNLYNENDPYGYTHKNARSGAGTDRGKGTGYGGHGDWLPNSSLGSNNGNCFANTINVITKYNFDTNPDVETGPGNKCDRDARRVALNKSLYSYNNRYGFDVRPSCNVDIHYNGLDVKLVCAGQQYGTAQDNFYNADKLLPESSAN